WLALRGLEIVSMCVGLLEEVSLSWPGPFRHLLAADFVWRELLFERAAGCGCNRRGLQRFFWLDLHRSLNVPRMLARKCDDRETHSHNKISAFEVPAQVREAANFGIHHQCLDLALIVVAGRFTLVPQLAARPALFQTLDLHSANRSRNPLCGVRFAGAKEDFCRGLRQHGLGLMAVARLQLAAPLEAKHYRIIRFAVLRNGSV